MDGFSSAHGAVDSVIGRLTSLLVSEAQLLAGVRGEVEFINDEMESMNGFVLHVSEADYTDHQVRAWMKQVRDLAYSSQDCVDLYVRQLSAGPRGSGLWAYLRRVPWLLRTMPARHQLATRIRELKVRAQEVGDRRQRYGVTVPPANDKHAPAAAAAGTQAPQPTGGEEDLGRLALVHGPPANVKDGVDQLIEWLGEDTGDRHGPRLILVVGSRGVGKTTLARRLYEHPHVQSLFDFKFFDNVEAAWTPSSVFVNIGRQVLCCDEMTHDDKERWYHNGASSLNKHLEGKRYLIVLDDVRHEMEWRSIKQGLPDGPDCPAGSAVVLFTKNGELAGSCSPNKIFLIPNFSSAPNFFFERAVALVGNKSYLKLHLGGILQKCYTDAFTVRMFLSLLYVNPDRTLEELRMLCNGLDDHCTSKNVETMLMFCYNDLPIRYRTALLYLAVFPQGYNIRRKSLARRWVFEGLFTQAGGSGQSDALHEAERCFDELIHRGFLSPADTGVAGEIKSCFVHHLLYEFITRIARSVHFVDTGLPPDLACRFSIRNRIGLEAYRPNLSSGSGSNAILTLLESLHTSSQWQVLRVLDLEGCEGLTKQHLKNICKIVLLKYLSLRNTDVTELPKEVQKLQCLETLDIQQTKIQALATKCITLPMLRHLLAGHRDPPRKNSGRFHESFLTVRLPGGIRRMKNLEELCHVDVSNNIDDLTDISQLLRLRKLGVLLQGRKSSLTILFQQIDKLHACLCSLSIRINQQTTREEITPDTEVVPVLVSPPKLLESLNISGIIGRLPNWIAELDKLAKITLCNTLLGEDAIHILGNLIALKYLRLRNDSYKRSELAFKKDNFQSLKSLVVEGTNIINISFDDRSACKLERIVWSFTRMQSLSGIQHLQKLKELDLNGNCDLDPVKHAIEEHPNHPVVKHNRHEETASADAAL